MTRDEEIGARQNSNVAEALEHGPGLRFSTRIWVVAKDPEHEAVLLGGLGAMGVGQMWQKYEHNPYVLEDETFVDAPIRDSTGGFGIHRRDV